MIIRFLIVNTMKKTQKNFLEWNNNILITSIKKIDLNMILIIILDALFYILSGYFVVFWLQRVEAKMGAFNLPRDIIALGQQRAQQLLGEAKTFYYLIVFSFILLLIAIIFLASILKGIIWAKTTSTKLSFALISKFLALNLIWMDFWFVLIILISLFVELASAPIFMIATIILGLYFSNTLYTIFMEKQKFKSILDALKLNVAKVHLFLLPYAVICLLFYIIVRINNYFQFNSTIFLSLILIIYAALVRYYVFTLVLEIEKLK